MKDILVFRNMQEMVNEADSFLTMVTDADVKACAKLLLISCYSYVNDYIADNAKKTYANLATLVKYELLETAVGDTKNYSHLFEMMSKAPDRAVSKKVFQMYNSCQDELKKKAQMHLMTLLLPYYLK